MLSTSTPSVNIVKKKFSYAYKEDFTNLDFCLKANAEGFSNIYPSGTGLSELMEAVGA